MSLSVAERHQGEAAFYNADMTKGQRTDVEQRFREGNIRFLVATKALGLGFDKADVRTVIHAYSPPSVTQWYQEFGRAARDENTSEAFLLPSKPWGVDNTIDTLMPLVQRIITLNKKKTQARIDDVTDYLLTKKQKSAEEIERAIGRGEALGVLNVNDSVLTFNRTDRSRRVLYGMEQSAMAGTEQLKFMASLREVQNACLWRQLLHLLDDTTVAADFRCEQCSAIECRGEYHGIRFDIFAGSGVVYKSCVGQTTVVCLSEAGCHLDLDPDRLKLIASKHLPGSDAVPALWVVACIPSRNPNVAEHAQEVAAALDFEFVDLVTLTSDTHPSMKDAKTSQERTTVLSKYTIDVNQLPDFGRVLLFDDVLNTGTTIGHIATQIKSAKPEIEVVGLVECVYKSLQYECVQL